MLPVDPVAPVSGLVEADDTEALPVPTMLIAATLKKYVVPLVKPVTVQLPAAVMFVQVPAATAEYVPPRVVD